MPTTRATTTLSLALLLVACGSRSALELRAPSRDAGARDAALHAVECESVELSAALGEPVTLRAHAATSAPLATIEWTLTSAPPASLAALRDARTSAATLVPDVLGDYRARFTARDVAGRIASCDVVVHAREVGALRVEITWDSEGTDMDAHLLHPRATRWFGDDDCHHANCIGGHVFFAPGPDEDDPRLDVDDADGFGPENLLIARPASGTYRVGVDAFGGSGRVTARIYCGGDATTPRRTLGPVLLREGDFWRVADVAIESVRCDVVELTRGARPDVATDADAMSRR